MATVRRLAGLGPREATSTTYLQALTWLEQRFVAAGYQVRRQKLQVPAGESWGVPVRAGTTWNLIATRPGFDAAKPHLVVGAHLDTVPQAPGAEDNASGVAVLLHTAQTLALRPAPLPTETMVPRPTGAGAGGVSAARLPTVFIAFGAEEPRGDGDNRHHYGSRAYVASLPAAHRRAVRGMVSLDRVGVGNVVPVCSATDAQVTTRNELLAAAARVGVPTRSCVNRSSDHWSFVRAGLPGARLGSTPYAAYHSARDLPNVLNPAQLDRMGKVVVSWLG
ncbi:M28 family metallopeptidase [Kribbella italica]|uniref:Zn-dependent M28 family amino/carboxypeptidase n=1 Tax=Kribbella italica TaxID=1540520 RepID=A0A7W9J4G3_9ACTN|nr:M28 family peptidase [Kribbella italica]MBB5835446.1 Zn-dependent M28 family amino/carboxypeptidase [Kribbella italica]